MDEAAIINVHQHAYRQRVPLRVESLAGVPDILRAAHKGEMVRAEKIAADRDDLRAELASWQHNYLHLRSLLGVDREDGETDAHLWGRRSARSSWRRGD